MLPLVDTDPDEGESIQPAGTSMMADLGLLFVSVDNRLAGIEGSTWTCGRAVPGVGGVVPGIQKYSIRAMYKVSSMMAWAQGEERDADM